jgi:hypothetical protein
MIVPELEWNLNKKKAGSSSWLIFGNSACC